MNTNEQTEKSLGQIFYEKYHSYIGLPQSAWNENPESVKANFEKAASDVEQAVLERLPGEYVLIPNPTQHVVAGDEWWADGNWKPWNGRQGLLTTDIVRRRIRRTEAKAEPDHVPELNARLAEMNEREILSEMNPFLTPEELRAMLGGRTAHREDGWRREWLLNGWRPLLPDEIPQGNSMYEWNGGFQKEAWRTCDDSWSGVKAKHAAPNSFFRTKAALPPITEQKPEGKCPQIGETVPSLVAQRAFDPASSESPPAGTDALPGVWELRCHTLRNQLQSVTKERDEARAINVQTLRDSQEQHARAEQAEKKLVEVEKRRQEAHEGAILWHQRHEQIISKLSTCKEDLLEERAKSELLEQKLQQAEASVPRWVSTSSRLPTRHDADENSKVWAVDREGVDLVYAFVSSAINYDFWMTPIPLPTPTEEKDAFSLWKQTLGDGVSMGDKRELMKQAFLAGAASNSPLTKD